MEQDILSELEHLVRETPLSHRTEEDICESEGWGFRPPTQRKRITLREFIIELRKSYLGTRGPYSGRVSTYCNSVRVYKNDKLVIVESENNCVGHNPDTGKSVLVESMGCGRGYGINERYRKIIILLK